VLYCIAARDDCETGAQPQQRADVHSRPHRPLESQLWRLIYDVFAYMLFISFSIFLRFNQDDRQIKSGWSKLFCRRKQPKFHCVERGVEHFTEIQVSSTMGIDHFPDRYFVAIRDMFLDLKRQNEEWKDFSSSDSKEKYSARFVKMPI
jgi:hypothetical protein